MLADASTFAGTEFEVVAKSQPDEWYNGFGQPYVPYGQQQPGEAGQPKVNHDYVWGMTTIGDDIWFGTSGNATVTSQMAASPRTINTPLQVGEGEYSQYPGVPGFLKPMLGDWRPPTMHRYNVNTGVVQDVTPNDPLLHWTLGIRSAGSNSQVVILAGADLTMTGTNYFAPLRVRRGRQPRPGRGLHRRAPGAALRLDLDALERDPDGPARLSIRGRRRHLDESPAGLRRPDLRTRPTTRQPSRCSRAAGN